MFVNREDAIRHALEVQTARQCAEGRHVAGCPHRPLSPWVRRALGHSLPATDRTGRIVTIR